jgi:hypothetical protein
MLVVDKIVTIQEYNNDVDTHIDLINGTYYDVSADGTIWAGVWFTGTNGPEGWQGWQANNNSPLPGTAPFSLLGKTAEDGYFLIGRGMRRVYQNATVPGPGTRLYLRINDDRPGNGSGAFTVHIRAWN